MNFILKTNTADTRNFNHRLNARIRYKIDSLNEISIRPRLSIQQNEGLSNTFGQTLFGTDLASQTDNTYFSDLSGLDFSKLHKLPSKIKQTRENDFS